jgi:hypothetical protein
LQCEACHGSTHAEFPSLHDNDNVRNQKIQGHPGVTVECTACHVSMAVNSSTATSGPHGMHPIGASWITSHHDLIGGNLAACQACHGKDNRGTVLSRAQANRTFTVSLDGGAMNLNLFRGALIGCYTCHTGPTTSTLNTNAAPTITTVAGSTLNNAVLNLPVTVTPPTATLRIISQPANGAMGVSNNVLTYIPEAGFVGSDTFTYAAWDTSKNSLLATGTVNVAQGTYGMGVVANVPTNAPAGWSAAFAAVANVTNYSGPVTFHWDFGDGAGSTNQFPPHTFAVAGTYFWKVVATLGAASATNAGSIVIVAPAALALTTPMNSSSSFLSLTWPAAIPDVVVEQTTNLSAGARWTVVTNLPVTGPVNSSVSLPVADGNHFFRVRQPW